MGYMLLLPGRRYPGSEQNLSGMGEMRIWLKPEKMKEFGLVPSDVSQALAEQNIDKSLRIFIFHNDVFQNLV